MTEPDKTRRNHPGVGAIGEITTTGPTVKVHGWTLRHCARNCPCHIHPYTGHLVILADADGSLGLHKYRVCDCCEPWMWHELAGYLKDLAAIAAIPTTEGHPS